MAVKKGLTTIILLLIVGFMSCNHERSSRATEARLRGSEYDVLSACLALKFANQPDGVSKVVVFNLTRGSDGDPMIAANGKPLSWNETAASLRERAFALQPSTLGSFHEVNMRPAILDHSLPGPTRYQIVNSDQLRFVPGKDGSPWGAFEKAFPGAHGILYLSRVGFSADGTQALLYMSYSCGSMCGEGSYVVMQKRNGAWTLEREVVEWVS